MAQSDPLGQEVAYGPSGLAFQHERITVATDGSFKDVDCMRIPARSVAVFGSASSTRPELSAIALALDQCLSTENLTIRSDSLDALTILFSLRRGDFSLSLHRHSMLQLIMHVVRLLNQQHAVGVIIVFGAPVLPFPQ